MGILPIRQNLTAIVNEPSLRSVEIYTYASVLLLSVASLALIVVFVSRRCERIFMEDGGTADCGIGIGWFLLAGAFGVIVLYSGYRLYRWLQVRENHIFVNVSTGTKIHAIAGMMACMIFKEHAAALIP